MSEETKTPVELIAQFSRCINFPRDTEGIQIFAQELKQAAEATKVPMESIVSKCREVADRAPEYRDMLAIGQEIADEEQRKQAAARDQRKEWERQYGKPQKFDVEWTLADGAKAHESRRQMNKAIWERLGKPKDGLVHVSWHAYFTVMAELGYPMTGAQKQYL